MFTDTVIVVFFTGRPQKRRQIILLIWSRQSSSRGIIFLVSDVLKFSHCHFHSSGTFCQEVAVKTDDDEETDVYKKFPKEIQIKFRDFIDDKLFPAVLEFMSKSYPRLFGVPIRWVQFEQLCFCFSSLGLSFNRKQQYDLFKIRHALNLPLGLSIKDGQDWVGAALRICGYIGQAGLADDLRTIIGDCFIPDEEDVGIDDPFKDGFLEYSSDEDE
jgi:hypothetical protein